MRSVRTNIGYLNAKWWHRCLALLVLFSNTMPLFALSSSGVEIQADMKSSNSSSNSKAILRELEYFKQLGSVLYIAAHPDDENTELLTYLSRGRKYRTAYLSLTRGDGGQNVLGADLGNKLGMARTQELLAARALDGAHQFFTRAIDFGFSKDYKETLTVWDKQEVLSDMVRVIRTFRPDILVTRFSQSPGGTHGHHTTSAILACEAFKLAGDPKAFPEQKLEAWQPKRILWNVGRFQKDRVTKDPIIKIEVFGDDSVTGKSFYDIASASRAEHKTQGFDIFKLPFVQGEKRQESFQFIDGEPASSDIMDGIDTTWSRFKDGDEIEKQVSDIISKFDVNDPSKSVPALFELRARLSKLPSNLVIKEKQKLLDLILQQCIGLKIKTTVRNSDVIPGEAIELHSTATVTSNLEIPVVWSGLFYPLLNKNVKADVELKPDHPDSIDSKETMPLKVMLTQPYWLYKEGTPGMFHVENPELIGMAENLPTFPIIHTFKIGKEILKIEDEPVQEIKNDRNNLVISTRKLNVIPPVSLWLNHEVAIFTPLSSQNIEVKVHAARAGMKGTLHLEAPKDWIIEPKNKPFHLKQAGDIATFTFKIKAPAETQNAKIVASADIGGTVYRNQRQEVNYAHLPLQLFQPPALLHAVCLDLKIAGKTVGYLPGAGDSLPENLKQMGYLVKSLDDATLKRKELDGLDAVILGVRVFNTRDSIAKAMPALLSYVEDGGTLIVQYNTSNKLKSEKIAPYDLRISADRVTDEKSKMTFLAPDHEVLNKPNKITQADFEGWVQERGLYFPDKWDPHFTPILACNDAQEEPKRGVLLVTKYGKGHYIYTGLSFFRELPAGVPGAYRLFANMVSIGK
ncbi:MAG: PIG-L family deacetylase [Candidatus Melainabacteria bacterium]|nr:PIG-L family deacetylase [Candidatus Melainabacteria bacterium]